MPGLPGRGLSASRLPRSTRNSLDLPANFSVLMGTLYPPLPPKTDSIFAQAVVLANRFVIIAGGRFQDNLCPHHLCGVSRLRAIPESSSFCSGMRLSGFVGRAMYEVSCVFVT